MDKYWLSNYNKNNGVFSLPYFYDNNKNAELKVHFSEFVREYHEWIHDIYFTPPITEPFLSDSMGMVQSVDMNTELEFLLDIQKRYNIPISATYNDTSVFVNEHNMLMFIDNFRKYYDMGIRNITLSPILWMLSGEIKKSFPDLYIKNTVLHRVRDGQMFWDHAVAGYDYINIDRELMRNEDQLKDVKKAQLKWFNDTGKYIPISILVNENCRGKCPVMNEHYHYNQNSYKNGNIPYFKSNISMFSCPKWNTEIPGYMLKVANILPINSEIEWIKQYVDVFKMHGRSTPDLLMNSIKLCKEFILDNGVSVPFEPELYKKWLKVTKNCKFQCYDCNLCGEVESSIERTEYHYLDNPSIFN